MCIRMTFHKWIFSALDIILALFVIFALSFVSQQLGFWVNYLFISMFVL